MIPSLSIIDESPDWLIVDKPPFLQVHPSKPGDLRTLWHSLRELLAYELVCGGQISLINRLDRETSGLVLIAKNRETARGFCRQMERREIRKEYQAIVWGWPAQESWTVEAPLLRQGERRLSPIYLKQAVHPDGAAASTEFEVEKRFTYREERLALVRVRPQTGRLHQIRVHLAHSGHAVIGDKIYGPDEQCYLEFIETGWTESLATRLLHPRHALHAVCLAPPGHEWHAPWPPDLRKFFPPE